MAADPRQKSVLLRDENIGVSTENQPRTIQNNGNDEQSSYVTLNRDWLRQLNLANEGSVTVHSLSVGRRPVVVQQPAIIVQPASAVVGDTL